MSSGPAPAISVERLMREIEDEIRRARRAKLLVHGGPEEYDDPDVFTGVEQVLRRALEDRNHEVLLLPHLLSDEKEWQLETELRFSSHRPVLGPFVLFVKRRILVPLMRWLYAYTLENFQRQQRVNQLLFACIEELAIENARLTKTIGRLEGGLEDGQGLERHKP